MTGSSDVNETEASPQPTPYDPGAEVSSSKPGEGTGASVLSREKRAEGLRLREEKRRALEEKRNAVAERKRKLALAQSAKAAVPVASAIGAQPAADAIGVKVAKPRPAAAAPKESVLVRQVGKAVEPAAATEASAPSDILRPPAGPARMKRRHLGVVLSLLLFVVAPVSVTAWYLWNRAVDQYASTLGFSVHREDVSSAISMISGLSSLSGTASADTDIIYRYIFSQQVVQEIQDEVDLRAMWSKPQNDPVFSFAPSGSIEDLVSYWSRMVKVYYDSTTHLIEVRVLAFDPQDAKRIAEAIYLKSTEMINRLNDVATEDSVRLARDELELTLAKLVTARQAMTAFRNANQIVDPAADVAAQASILASLQQELATTLIDYDLLRGTAPDTDPRLPPMERRIQVIQDRIKAERAKLGAGEGGAFADIVAEYEKLKVDLEFAEASYNAARAAYDAAQAEARQQSRYLAAHVLPTLAETSRYPERPMLFAIIGALLTLAWAIAVLIYYSFRDRR